MKGLLMNNLEFNHFKDYLNKNLLDSNIKISIDELLCTSFNNSHYLKNTLTNDQMDNILLDIVKLVHYHKLNEEKLTLYYDFLKDKFSLTFIDYSIDDEITVFHNQDNLVNIVNYLSNKNFKTIIKKRLIQDIISKNNIKFLKNYYNFIK